MTDIDIDLLEDLLSRFAAIEDRTVLRLRGTQMELLSPGRPGIGSLPTEPTVGYSPFQPATLIAAGAIDFATLAAALITVSGGFPHVGLAGDPGTASKLNRSDHAHPAQLNLSAGAAASANYLARHKLAADTLYRLLMGLDASDQPFYSFGPGNAAIDARIVRTGTRELSIEDPGNPATQAAPLKVAGPVFARGPMVMDLAISYASPGVPNQVVRTDDVGAISTSIINYAGAQVASVVTTRFGRTITVTPTYTGADITAIHRAVT